MTRKTYSPIYIQILCIVYTLIFVCKKKMKNKKKQTRLRWNVEEKKYLILLSVFWFSLELEVRLIRIHFDDSSHRIKWNWFLCRFFFFLNHCNDITIAVGFFTCHCVCFRKAIEEFAWKHLSSLFEINKLSRKMAAKKTHTEIDREDFNQKKYTHEEKKNKT